MKLYNEDCLKVIPTLENNSIDLLLTDPPYNLGNLEIWICILWVQMNSGYILYIKREQEIYLIMKIEW